MHGLLELSQCLTDGDPDSLHRNRKRRSLGFGASVALQAGLLAAIVVVSIASPALLPRIVPVMAAPFSPAPPPPVTPPVVAAQTARTFQPSVIPPHIVERSRDLPGGADPGLTGVQVSPVPELLVGLGPTADSGPRKPVEAATAHTAPVARSSGVMEAMLINRVQPVYPQVARITHTFGRVELRAIIGTDGSVRSLEVVSGNPLLVKAALDAVLQWKYSPTLLDGEAVEVATFVTVDFVLQ
jgi:periplasmic protein TonB